MSGSWIGRRLAVVASSAAIMMLAGAVCAAAEEAHGIEITGDAVTTGTLTPDELSHLPAVEQEVLDHFKQAHDARLAETAAEDQEEAEDDE